MGSKLGRVGVLRQVIGQNVQKGDFVKGLYDVLGILWFGLLG